jgi:membrane protein
MVWRNSWTTIREPVLQALVLAGPLPEHPWPRRIVAVSARAIERFWQHGDLFSSAAISFYALFSLLPLVILFLIGLQVFVPYDLVQRNLGRLFGLTDTDLVLRTIRDAYAQEATLGWIGALTLILAATGVFSSVQVALDRVWECRGRTVHLRFLVGVAAMASSLLIFLAMLMATVFVFRFIRTSIVGEWLGWPRTPPPGTGSALTIATGLAQFVIFWTAYRFLPNVPVRWGDALPGAVAAAVIWHAIAYGLSWYLGTVADYTTLYHSLGVIVALIASVYGLSASFLLGAEFVAQRTRWPEGRGDPTWQQPVHSPIPSGQGSPPTR